MQRSREKTIPFQRHGWTAREAAAHLLDRFGFGPRPGEIRRVVAEGPASWFARQLDGKLGPANQGSDRASAALERRLASLDLLDLPVRTFSEILPRPALLVRELREVGLLAEDVDPRRLDPAERARLRPSVVEYARSRGYRSTRDYERQLIAQKIYRALYSPFGLRESLVDFWFNHFNVSLHDSACRPYVLAYERDAIRPHVVGRFRDLLGATAKHPAMLRYLDNANSSAEPGRRTTLDAHRNRFRRALRAENRGLLERMEERRESTTRPRGLNENYARELMELHTLGVDGGYEQEDVVEVARAFTGWAVYPEREFLERVGPRFDRALEVGVLRADGGFLFRSDAHDAEAKRVLGHSLAAGRGIEDGEEVLDRLAEHPSTARFLSRKLAVRFVADHPPEALVDRLAERFRGARGDLSEVLWELVTAPEFWDRSVRHQKIKTPFELAISALRAVDASVHDAGAIADWVDRIGQPLYRFDAPTGYPDRADFWVSAGGLLNRMNFGLTLGRGDVGGVETDLLALNRGREPESRGAALTTYAGYLLPERAFDPAPLLALSGEAELVDRVRVRAASHGSSGRTAASSDAADLLDWAGDPSDQSTAASGSATAAAPPEPNAQSTRETIGQVVGVLLGSPEFQRR